MILYRHCFNKDLPYLGNRYLAKNKKKERFFYKALLNITRTKQENIMTWRCSPEQGSPEKSNGFLEIFRTAPNLLSTKL
jgi:hypothetical protein